MNWLNENKYRAYPFIRESPGFTSGIYTLHLPNEIILDAGFMVGSKGYFKYGVHHVYLDSIILSNGSVTYKVKAYSDDVDDQPIFGELLFTGTTSSGIQILSATNNEGCRGFLVTGGGYNSAGNLTLTVITKAAAEFEPARIQNLYKSRVNAINIANRERMSVGDCEVPASTPSTAVSWLDPTFTGQVIFTEGYNCNIETNLLSNSLTISAKLGAGKGTPCSGNSEEVIGNDAWYGELPITPEEITKVENGEILSGGPKCTDLIFQINGTTASESGNLQINGGRGVTIISKPDEHKLVIQLGCENLLLGCDTLAQI